MNYTATCIDGRTKDVDAADLADAIAKLDEQAYNIVHSPAVGLSWYTDGNQLSWEVRPNPKRSS